MDGLDFLYSASNENLVTLCDLITKNKDGETRFNEELTSSDAYKLHYPDNMKFLVTDMIRDLRKFGGNTMANILRGGNGPEYSEILRDVAGHCKVNFEKSYSDERIEKYLLQKLFDDTVEKMSDEELAATVKGLGLDVPNLNRQALMAALLAAWNAGGFQSYILLVSVANAMAKFLLGRGLNLAVNAGLTRFAAIFTGPIGWILTGLWTAIDLAGPAYRVTVPAVIQIAYMRQVHNTPVEIREQALLN